VHPHGSGLEEGSSTQCTQPVTFGTSLGDPLNGCRIQLILRDTILPRIVDCVCDVAFVNRWVLVLELVENAVHQVNFALAVAVSIFVAEFLHSQISLADDVNIASRPVRVNNPCRELR
jgi:hypothetical protein